MGIWLGWAGTALELILMWRLVAWRAWRQVPWSFVFFAVLFLHGTVTFYFYLAGYGATREYSFWYWTSGLVAGILRFPVAWEVTRKLFRGYSRVYQSVSAVILVLLLGLGALYLFGSGPEVLRLPDIERKIALTTALWMLVFLLLAQYYRVTPSRNIWGIAVGLGLFAATTLINFSALGINEEFFPVFAYVRPVSFILTLLIWTWTLWSYTPNPQPAASPLPEYHLLRTHSYWQKIRAALAKALGL